VPRRHNLAASSYPQTGSLLSDIPQTGLSTLITIKVRGTPIGAIQELRIDQNRDMLVWEEIGTDGVVEIHPKGSAKITFSVTRIVFDQLRLPEAFVRGFLNLQAQRIPFDVDIIDTFAGNAQLAAIHTMKGCWFKRYSTPFRADNFIISETAELLCERIISMQGNSNVANGGLRGLPVEYDTIERQTDFHGRPGKFDPAF
jgi:hypothetical protein